jgi:hypothetical protein
MPAMNNRAASALDPPRRNRIFFGKPPKWSSGMRTRNAGPIICVVDNTGGLQ